jgi:hypothetical protein
MDARKHVIDFATLTSVLRVMSLSPSWDEANAAMTNLETLGKDGRDYDGRATDEQAIRAFARLVRDDSGLVFRAIVHGDIVGALVSSDVRAERIIRGLQAIKTAYRFEDRNENAVAEAFDTLAADEGRFFESDIDDTGVTVTEVDQIDGWRRRLDKRLSRFPGVGPAALHNDTFPRAGNETSATAEKNYVTPLNIYEVQDRAWARAAERLETLLSGRIVDRVPSVEELLCAAANISPSTVVPLRLENMSLAQWSDLLFDAIGGRDSLVTEHAPAPYRFAYYALTALGFSVVPLMQRKPWNVPRSRSPNWSAESTQANSFHSSRTRPEAGRSMIILRRPTESMTSAWQASRTTAALAVTQTQLGVFASTDLLRQFGAVATPYPSLVAVELPQDFTTDIEKELARQIIQSESSGRPVPVVYFSQGSARDTSRTVIAPRSLDELAAGCFAMVSAS